MATEACQRLLSQHMPSPDAMVSSNQDTGLRDALKIILEQRGDWSKADSQIHIQVPYTLHSCYMQRHISKIFAGLHYV